MGFGWRRRAMALAAFTVALCPLALDAHTAGAFPAGDPVFSFTYNVDATTHIERSDQTIEVDGGSFTGGIDLNTLQLEGAIVLPPTSFTFKLAGTVPLVTATAAIVPTAPVTGMLGSDDAGNLDLTATTVFNIRITDLHAEGTHVNLVGDSCTTASPITLTMSGEVDFGGPSTMSGTFTIPPFRNCGLATTPALDLTISGPGNTFTATATPS